MPPAAVTPIHFERILLASDLARASEAAFYTALRVASEARATLVILHVFEYADSVPVSPGDPLVDIRSLFEEARNSLDRLTAKARAAGLTCQPIMGTGVPSLTVLETIAAEHIDLTILGTNALRGFERFIFGSTAEAVLRQSPRPVMTVGPLVPYRNAAHPATGPIVFATDFQQNTISAIGYATSFCDLEAAPLHCLHVLPRALDRDPNLNRHIPRIVTEALLHVASATGAPVYQPICAIAYASHISDAVVDYAREVHARLIVLGVTQKSMLATHGPTRVAYSIIAESPCPVLTMAFDSHAAPRTVAQETTTA